MIPGGTAGLTAALNGLVKPQTADGERGGEDPRQGAASEMIAELRALFSAGSHLAAAGRSKPFPEGKITPISHPRLQV